MPNRRRSKALSRIILVIVIAAAVVAGVYFIVKPGGEPAGAKEPAASGVSASDVKGGIIINEAMADNGGIFPDEKGEYSDWVEIYNGSGSDVNLQGLSLTDDEQKPAKWSFPSVTLKDGGYLVVFLSGKASDDGAGNYHAGFKLSASEGDKILLTNAAGETLDKLEFEFMNENCSFARKDGAWVETQQPTPGYPNTEEGFEAFRQSRVVPDSPVVLNEAMTSNNVTIKAPDGGYHDYIELVNRGGERVNLEGFGLSDDPGDPMQFRLPAVSLDPGQCLLIFCSGERVSQNGANGDIYAPFRLSSYREEIGLYDAVGRQLDSVTVEEIPADTSYSREYQNGAPSDSWKNTSQVTPGYPNTEDGYNEFIKKNELALGDLTINEVLAANTSLDLEGDGVTYDFIELKNNGSSPIDLTGYALTTNTKNPARWRFPSETIGPGETLLVLSQSDGATGDPQNYKYLHASFGISKQGEVLALFDPDANLLDAVRVPQSRADVSIGRENGRDGLYFFTTPTPGAENTGGSPGFTQQPSFSAAPGIYDSALDVELTCQDGETIYYTTDCTEPTASSTPYSGPIRLDKNTVIRAVAMRDGYITGYSKTGTYLFTTDGAVHEQPVCSLVTDPKNLWDADTGIYVKGNIPAEMEWPYDDHENTFGVKANFWQSNRESERPASFEVFNDSGKAVFSQNVATRIAGAYGRGSNQKPFAVIARSEHGDNRLRYPFFTNRDFTEYKSLVLRPGAQDTNRSKIRDELSTGLVDGKVNFLVQAYKPYVLYLNGEYWGTYFMKDKRNEHFVAAHLGVDPDDVTNIMKASTQTTVGTNEEWLELMSYIKSHDLSQKDAYDYVAQRIDVNSFMDYMICEIYVANSDYANIQYYKDPTDGKWRWIYYDFCWGWNNVNHSTLALRRGDRPAGSDLFNALLKNDGWRTAFIERFAEIMDTIYDPDIVNAKIDELAAIVKPEIEREREFFATDRFDQNPKALPGTYEGWEKQIDYLHKFANERPEIMKYLIKKEFGLSDEYMMRVFGSVGTPPAQS